MSFKKHFFINWQKEYKINSTITNANYFQMFILLRISEFPFVKIILFYKNSMKKKIT